jgi:hypothetical protein
MLIFTDLLTCQNCEGYNCNFTTLDNSATHPRKSRLTVWEKITFKLSIRFEFQTCYLSLYVSGFPQTLQANSGTASRNTVRPSFQIFTSSFFITTFTEHLKGF